MYIHYKIIYIYIIRKILEKMYSYTHGHYGFVGTQAIRQMVSVGHPLLVTTKQRVLNNPRKECKITGQE